MRWSLVLEVYAPIVLGTALLAVPVARGLGRLGVVVLVLLAVTVAAWRTWVVAKQPRPRHAAR